jgi:DNA helicase-2/ATP-dependent DNA helicase PcrA
MPEIATIIGGAGTGKTTHLLNLMEWWLRQDFMDWRDIGFCSFTRAARLEAMSRAADRFGFSVEEMEKDGWFRTYHGCCFKLLRIRSASLIADSVADRKWLSDAVGEPVSGATEDEGHDILEAIAGRAPADAALSLWDAARNRLVPLEHVWRRAMHCDHRTPSLEFCIEIASRYEQRKRLDNRIDYTDVLGRYAGWMFTPLGHYRIEPEGRIPLVDVWFLDEAQDNSALSDQVARRLTSQSRFVYVVGDPFQAIYSFSGADPSHFQAWTNRDRLRILQKSYRCAEDILRVGEDVLQSCSDYWDRNIQPADHAGDVRRVLYREPWIREINPASKESWLLLCRTNFIASRMAKRLDSQGIPWVSTNGHGSRWSAPVRFKAFVGLTFLEEGWPITAEQWQAAVSKIPVKNNLQPGAKTEWKSYCGDPEKMNDLDHLHEWGASPCLVESIRRGEWPALIDAVDFREAYKKYGLRAIESPRVRIGTIHSAKGMEADNVVLLTTITHQVHRGMEDRAGRDEEARLWYVGATRARTRLLIAREPDAKYQWVM